MNEEVIKIFLERLGSPPHVSGDLLQIDINFYRNNRTFLIYERIYEIKDDYPAEYNNGSGILALTDIMNGAPFMFLGWGLYDKVWSLRRGGQIRILKDISSLKHYYIGMNILYKDKHLFLTVPHSAITISSAKTGKDLGPFVQLSDCLLRYVKAVTSKSEYHIMFDEIAGIAPIQARTFLTLEEKKALENSPLFIEQDSWLLSSGAWFRQSGPRPNLTNLTKPLKESAFNKLKNFMADKLTMKNKK